jgi:hypothetical protein
MKPFKNAAVASRFEAYPPKIRRKLIALRRMIFDTAASTQGVGKLEETLRWGEPAYITAESRSGSTIRIDWKKAKPTQYAMYFNCQTSLIDTFRSLFPSDFKFEGNRALIFEQDDAVPVKALKFCIAASLTYHHRKQGNARPRGHRLTPNP